MGWGKKESLCRQASYWEPLLIEAAQDCCFGRQKHICHGLICQSGQLQTALSADAIYRIGTGQKMPHEVPKQYGGALEKYEQLRNTFILQKLKNLSKKNIFKTLSKILFQFFSKICK